MINMDMWQFLDTATPHADSVRALVNWSMNYDTAAGTPWHVFLDLIGYSDDAYGCKLMDGKSINLGYVELDYIGDALKEYAQYPLEVTQWLEELDQLEVCAYERA